MDQDEMADVADLIQELEALSESVESERTRERVEDVLEAAREAQYPGVFGRVISGFDRADAAEAFVGSVVFGIPMIIESGTLEVGEFIATHPVFYLGTLAFGLAVVYGILYVADIQHVEVVSPILGIVPRRFAAVIVIAFTTSLVLMTAWGRVDWGTPGVASAQVVFVFVGMAIGGALGDILPGS